jgi:hypothetical protein
MVLDRTTLWSDAVSEPLTGEHFVNFTCVVNGIALPADEKYVEPRERNQDLPI